MSRPRRRSCAEPCRSSLPRSTRLFAEVRASIENAHALGMYDPVTSLPNRLHFRSEADKLLGEALDGHQLGDAVRRSRPLQERQRQPRPCARRPAADHGRQPAARRRQRRVRRQAPVPRPLLARLAGDEFTMFFPEIASADEIERVARRIVLAISEPFELCAHSVDIGASIGVAISPRSWHQHRSADARRRHRHVPRQVERRRPALPVHARTGRRASAARSRPKRR